MKYRDVSDSNSQNRVYFLRIYFTHSNIFFPGASIVLLKEEEKRCKV